MASQASCRPEARTKRRYLLIAQSLAHQAHPTTEDQDHPHVCNADGWVTIGQIALDPETGEEVEEFALYLCRRCAGEEGQG
jgi:hypothetical protein